MKWLFDNGKPIYIQILYNLKLAIITGVYSQGDKMPSVRELALEFEVNPNTVQKALIELEELGLVYTQRTSGRYVTEDSKKIEKIKNLLMSEKANSYLIEMGELGLTEKESLEYLLEKETKNEISGM